MSGTRLVLRNLWHHRRSHACVLLGVALAAAVLVGALGVGDSVRYTLHRTALLRLGQVQLAAALEGRFYAAELAQEVATAWGGTCTAALQVPGLALTEDSHGEPLRRAGEVRVYGVEPGFWALAAQPGPGPDLAEGQVALGRQLAATLGVAVGDEVVLRVARPGLLPRGAPLASRRERATLRLNLVVAAVLDEQRFGRFDLAANQQPPANAFLSLPWLQQRLDLAGRANLLLLGGTDPEQPGADAALGALRQVWRPGHSGIRLREVPEHGVVVLDSDRVFLDDSVAAAALALPGARGSFTYLVNRISRVGAGQEPATPYSFVTALEPLDADLPPDGVLANRWLSEQLGAVPGDRLRFRYSRLTDDDRLVEQEREFTLHGVVGADAATRERELAPAFPGLTDVEICADWDVGLPLDPEQLRDPANQAYWDAYRHTPKALLPLAAGRVMWGNRFGSLTAVRYPLTTGGLAQVADALRTRLHPEDLGLALHPVRGAALAAVDQAQDLGQLFLGMSLFLIAAALLLTALLFSFGVRARAAEVGTLLAVGIPGGRVRVWLLAEAALVAAAGSVLGCALGTLYTRFLLWGLGHRWSGAVADAALHYRVTPTSLAVGCAAGFFCALLAVGLVVRRQARQPVAQLLGEDLEPHPSPARPRRTGTWLLGPLLASAAAAATVAHAVLSGADRPAGAFFAAGALLLLAGLGLLGGALGRLGRGATPLRSLPSLSLRSTGRRRWRSLAAAGLVACGAFLVVAVAAMRHDPGAQAGQRDAGTGGFALLAETSLPLEEDVARLQRRLAQDTGAQVQLVPLRLRDGDDAGCLNLNRAQQPRLLGVDPGKLSRLGAFLARTGPDLWSLLAAEPEDGSVPALVGDADTARWGLQARTGVEDGDLLELRDEWGQPLQVRLVGHLPMRLSLFQGALLIAERQLLAHYPSDPGYRVLLVDTAAAHAAGVGAALSDALGRSGVAVTATAERLRRFYRVEASYLNVFLALGGLGVALGSLGLGIVVLRNGVERRGELATLRALGWSRAQVSRLLRIEHGILVLAGLALGGGAAGVAVLPALGGPEIGVQPAPLLAVLGAILAVGMLAVVGAAALATRGDPVAALRND